MAELDRAPPRRRTRGRHRAGHGHRGRVPGDARLGRRHPRAAPGYATEAVRALADWLRAHGVTTLTAHIHPRHIASQTVAKRIGLTPTNRIVDGETVWAASLEGLTFAG